MGGLFWKKKMVGFSCMGNSEDLNVRVVPFWYEGIGLMFTKEKTANALMFTYSFSTRMTIFSSFIPYDFLAVWINSKNEVVNFQIVKPGENGVEPGVKFRKLVEIPFNKKHRKVVDFFMNKKNNKEKIIFYRR